MNLFMFSFKKQEDALEVIRKGPWYVMSKLISLQQWTHQAVMKEIDFSKVRFWVLVHGLPMEYMNARNAEKILNHMGELEEIENMFVEGQIVRQFVRAKIRINVLQPLSTGFWVPCRNLPKVWVNLKYEKLQDMCFNCGVIGHDQRGCREEKKMSSYRGDIPRYGPRLSVPPAKELSLILEESERWKYRPTGGSRYQNTGNRTDQNDESSIYQGTLVVRRQEEGLRGRRGREVERG